MTGMLDSMMKTGLSKIPWNVTLKKGFGNLLKTSVVVSQMATVDKGRLLEKIGPVSRKLLDPIIEGCQKVISISVF
jgi:hypothetical protein